MCASQHMSSEWLDVHDERMNSGTQARLLLSLCGVLCLVAMVVGVTCMGHL